MEPIRWYQETDAESLADLVAICHPHRPPRVPLWWQAIPTLVVPDGDGLIAYTQMSLGEQTLFLYDTGVSPSHRRAGWARALMARRLILGAQLGAFVAVGYTDVENVGMDRLLTAAHFTKEAPLPRYYGEFDPPRDGHRYLSTPKTWMWAAKEHGRAAHVEAA